jgi:hypothetical protein
VAKRPKRFAVAPSSHSATRRIGAEGEKKVSEEQNFQVALARLQHRYAMEYQMIQATAAFEHAALRPLFFLNGGAAAGFTALYGALQPGPGSAYFFRLAIITWVVGLLLASTAAFAAAYSQFNFRKYRSVQVSVEERAVGISVDRSDWAKASDYAETAQFYRRVAVWAGAGSLLLFIVALVPAVKAVE